MASIKTNFTKSYIESLAQSDSGARTYFYDTKVLGLELCVQSTGSKSFAVRRSINGRSHRVVLGRYDGLARQPIEFDSDPLIVLGKNPGLTLDQARLLAQAVVAELSKGGVPQGLKKKQPEHRLTLGELFRVYIDNYAMEHTKTWEEMERCFDRYLTPWKDRPVDEITRADVQLLVNKVGKHHGKTTANRMLELLRAVMNKGKHWSLISGENPAVGVAKFRLKPRERFVTASELPRLMDAISKEPNAEVRDYVKISLSTGARKSNVLAMRWDQLDLDDGIWTIPDTKNGTSQTILLTEEELALLRERHKQRKSFEWVFPGPDNLQHLKDPKKGWARILEKAGIKDLRLHDLRRTLGSYMAMTGASLSVIGNTLNHKDVSTTRKVYAQSAREAELAARQIAHKRMFDSQSSEGKVASLKRATECEF